MQRSKRAILTTLLYSDIFSYPLTKEELWQYLTTEKPVSRITFEKALISLRGFVSQGKGYYFLAGRQGLITRRERFFRESKRKLRYAERIVPLLSTIPTVLFIGVSGSVAMHNSSKADDIDLFIITKRKTMWLTRLLLTLLLAVTGRRRGRKDAHAANLFCLNMLLDERSLRLPSNRQSIYTAHEVVRMIPLYDRSDTYSTFLRANNWVKKYVPNAVNRESARNYTQNYAESGFSIVQRLVPFISVLEPFAKRIQLWYMKRHRTTEEVTDTLLAFHPLDYRPKVLSVLKKRLVEYRVV